MRLLEVLLCKASSWQGHLQRSSDGWKSYFSLWRTDASPSGDENQQQPLDVPEAIRPFQLDSSGKTKAMPSGEALQNSQCSSPAEAGAASIKMRMQRGCKVSQHFGAPTSVLPGMGRILASKIHQPRHKWPLSEASQMAPG